MSIPFSSINGAEIQTLLNELRTAYIEACLAISVPCYEHEYPVHDEQIPFVLHLQEWLEENCVNFIDHINGPIIPDESDFLSFTIETWRQTVFSTNGYRRSKEWNGINDPTWLTTGTMSRGDILNAWIISDLQHGFSALRKSLWIGNQLNNRSYIAAVPGGYWPITCSEYQAILDAEWSSAVATGWQTNYNIMSPGAYVAHARLQYSEDFVGMQMSRQRGKAQLSGLSGTPPRTARVYLKPCKAPTGYILIEVVGDFLDMDGLGWEENKLYLFESWGENESTTLTSGYIGDTTNSPRILAGFECPISGMKVAGISSGTDSYWLLDWNFTYQNT